MSRLWDKGKQVDDLALRFTVGDDHIIDTGLIPFDLEGTKAHARSLAASGLLTAEELAQIEAALETLLERHRAGELQVSLEQEDCHTLIEAELTKLLGDVGLKIHAGRSRNDQAVTMLRLAMRSRLGEAAAALGAIAAALCQLADRSGHTPMPGYTHMQRAMPSSAAIWALGYAEVLCERAESALGLRKHLARSPLGSAAGYGVPMALNRQASADSLGFRHPQAVTAVQLTRGLDELAFVQQLQLAGVAISRMAADLVLFSTQEYRFIRLEGGLTTGSSIMPQKNNPDLLELMRAHGATLTSHAVAISSLLAGLPGGYQRDLQLTKQAMDRAWHDARTLFDASRRAVDGISFDPVACASAMSPELHATAAAYRMVRDGKPFRQAYREAAADPKLWVSMVPEPAADCADNPKYAERLLVDIQARLGALESALTGDGA